MGRGHSNLRRKRNGSKMHPYFVRTLPRKGSRRPCPPARRKKGEESVYQLCNEKRGKGGREKGKFVKCAGVPRLHPALRKEGEKGGANIFMKIHHRGGAEIREEVS